MRATIDRGLPFMYSNYGMAGATTPITPAGILAMLNAELLAGLVLSQLIKEGMPINLGSMPASVVAAIEAFNYLSPGDVVLLNDPYHGGTHLPDVTMVSPVFCVTEERSPPRAAAPSFFVASRAHHADVGGMAPGSLPLSTELYQEGIVIPPVKLVEGGRRNQGVLALLTANSRAPAERLGDLEAQMAAHRVGERRTLALTEAHGQARVREHALALMDYARRTTEAAIANGFWRDIYLVIGDPQADGGWAVRTFIKPFANWIWAGAIIMSLGGLLSLTDRRFRVAPGAVKARDSAVPAE